MISERCWSATSYSVTGFTLITPVMSLSTRYHATEKPFWVMYTQVLRGAFQVAPRVPEDLSS